MRALLFILPSQKMPRPFSEKTLEVFARKYPGYFYRKMQRHCWKNRKVFLRK